MNKVAVIDYGMGNLHSVTKAIEYVGRELGEETEVLVTSNAQDISQSDRIVFPGVGAIRDCMAEIKRLGIDKKIQDAIKERTDFYSALLARLKRLQEELIVSGINCRPPKAVILEFQNTIEKGGISDYTVFMRDAKGRYDQHIRKQAENLIDGIKISTKEQLSMNDYLDRFLRHDRVIESWG